MCLRDCAPITPPGSVMPKTYKVIITPEAESDLFAMYDYIANRSGHARAGTFVERIEAHCRGLSLFPERGTKRETLPSDLHITTYRHQATVAYVIDRTRDQVSILRIFRPGRDFESALSEDDPL